MARQSLVRLCRVSWLRQKTAPTTARIRGKSWPASNLFCTRSRPSPMSIAGSSGHLRPPSDAAWWLRASSKGCCFRPIRCQAWLRLSHLQHPQPPQPPQRPSWWRWLSPTPLILCRCRQVPALSRWQQPPLLRGLARWAATGIRPPIGARARFLSPRTSYGLHSRRLRRSSSPVAPHALRGWTVQVV